MRTKWMVVAQIAVTVLAFSLSQLFAQSSKDKEAEKHYQIAVEALNKNDLATAIRELRAASELAPANATVWYDLAVVESKQGDFTRGLQHLRKAQRLGLPKSPNVDQLESALTRNAPSSNAPPAVNNELGRALQAIQERLEYSKTLILCSDQISKTLTETHRSDAGSALISDDGAVVSLREHSYHTIQAQAPGYANITAIEETSDYVIDLRDLKATAEVQNVQISTGCKSHPKEFRVELTLSTSSGQPLIKINSDSHAYGVMSTERFGTQNTGEMGPGRLQGTTNHVDILLYAGSEDLALNLAKDFERAILAAGGKPLTPSERAASQRKESEINDGLAHYDEGRGDSAAFEAIRLQWNVINHTSLVVPGDAERAVADMRGAQTLWQSALQKASDPVLIERVRGKLISSSGSGLFCQANAEGSSECAANTSGQYCYRSGAETLCVPPMAPSP